MNVYVSQAHKLRKKSDFEDIAWLNQGTIFLEYQKMDDPICDATDVTMEELNLYLLQELTT